jgi:hypothetical protein
MYEVLNDNQKQVALSLIKKHFNPKSEILKELMLYQSLSKETKNDGAELLSLTLESRKSLNHLKLEAEKYDLVKDIRKKYDIKTFFETRTANYKLCASIFKLFEHSPSMNPDEYLTAKKTVLETITGQKREEVLEEQVERDWRDQDKDTRTLGFKIVVQKFNEKYRTLSDRQKTLLSRYINEDTSTPEFKNYVMKEVGYVNSKLQSLADFVNDPITKIKLMETLKLTQNIISAKQVKDEHLSSLLKYFELIEELQS